MKVYEIIESLSHINKYIYKILGVCMNKNREAYPYCFMVNTPVAMRRAQDKYNISHPLSYLKSLISNHKFGVARQYIFYISSSIPVASLFYRNINLGMAGGNILWKRRRRKGFSLYRCGYCFQYETVSVVIIVVCFTIN